MKHFFFQFRPLKEARLIQLESIGGTESAPEAQSAPEQREAVQGPEDAEREGGERQTTAQRDVDKTKDTLTSPSADVSIELDTSSQLDQALQKKMSLDEFTAQSPQQVTTTTPLHREQLEFTEADTVPVAQAQEAVNLELATATENRESATKTPQEQLWAEFVELSQSLKNPQRVEALRQTFMNIPNDRADAMLRTLEDGISIQERNNLNRIIVDNSALLNKFSDEGFTLSLQLLTAGSNEERHAIVAKLPPEDRQLVDTKWPAEATASVQKYLDVVDSKLESNTKEAPKKQPTPQEMRAEIAKIDNPILKGIMQAMVDILYGEPPKIKEVDTELQKKVKNEVDAELKETEQDTLLKGYEKKQKELQAEIEAESDPEQKAERAKELETISAKIAYLKSLSAEAVAPAPKTIDEQAIELQQKIEALQEEFPNNKVNFSIDTMDIAGQDQLALIFDQDASGDVFKALGEERVVLLNEDTAQKTLEALRKMKSE